LEFIPGVTQSVAVPLVRTNDVSSVATNIFCFGSVTQDVVWAAEETSRSVIVDVRNLAVNATMELYKSDRTLRASSTLYAVDDPGNSISNPKFVGEDFSWGEWTMDYGAAKDKVATDPDARLLAVFSGVLWCPYCEKIEESLFSSQDFKTWAVSNKIVLVLFDQGKKTEPQTAAGLAWPRLVTCQSDPGATADNAVSGAGYVSRKGIDSVAAEEYMNTVTEYTRKWLAPGSTANVLACLRYCL
jgi:hypothetical protein